MMPASDGEREGRAAHSLVPTLGTQKIGLKGGDCFAVRALEITKGEIFSRAEILLYA